MSRHPFANAKILPTKMYSWADACNAKYSASDLDFVSNDYFLDLQEIPQYANM